ncbi:hypothetical protein QTP88_003017 [Uroleucon formosanum]
MFSTKRVKLGGAEYKRRAKVKKLKLEELKLKIPKLQTFFTPSALIIEDQSNLKLDKTPDLNNAENDDELIIDDHPKSISDPALWKINKSSIDYFILNQPKQNVETINFNATRRSIGKYIRYLPRDIFKRTMQNGETAFRDWICILIQKMHYFVFIVCCLVDIKHHLRIKEEVLSIGEIVIKTLVIMKNHQVIIVETLKFLTSRGLAIRGSNETLGSVHNGNYLNCLELIAKCDPFISQHLIKYGNKGRGNVSYISSTICTEFIMVMEEAVIKEIVNQIQSRMYFSIIVDSTPDITKIDQLTIAISDNFIQDPGEKSTNALILFSSGFGPYQPNNIIFPQHSGRKFRPEWYSSFPWIEYSPSSNSAFCFYCRAFPSNTSDPTFVSVGFKQWSKASYKSFPQHEKSFGYKEASAKLAGYKSSKKSGSIISKVNTHHQQIVADNRAYLKCILDSLLYCARQGIAVRGHREDEDSSNKGNFLELLTLRANDNDIIQRYFIEKEKTFRYVSGDYTNTFLEYLANIVIKNIIDNVIAAGIFSIIVDETQDLSRHEQVAIIIRYATKDLSPAEVFLGFYETETTDGETLSMLIKSTFVSHGLKIENIRGQCYDGAASMRGSYKGVQARIREENHLAMYIHCNAHILNLCLIDLAKQVSYVRNVFGTLNTLHNFIGASSKRHAIFEKMYSVLNVSTCDGPKTLKSLSDTRWSCRLDALKAVLLNFQTVVSTLEDISENDAVYGSDANALLKSINTFEFLFCIYFLKNIMLLTNVLSKYLQSSSIIYSNVQSMAKETIQELCNMRCEESFNNTWNEVDILRKQYNVSSPILPRKQKIPAKLGGGLKEVENTTINKHYKINIYFAVLDNIINDMGERFEENNLYVLNCMQDILLNDMPNNNSFKEINKMYGFDEYNLKAETTILNRMYKTVHDQNNVQSKINFIASENYKAGFPTLTRLIQLFITIPTNSASCERSFSCLRRLKTYLRTTMGQSRLNSLGILQIERERSSLIDENEVIDKFSAAAECRGRRLLLQ